MWDEFMFTYVWEMILMSTIDMKGNNFFIMSVHFYLWLLMCAYTD